MNFFMIRYLTASSRAEVTLLIDAAQYGCQAQLKPSVRLQKISILAIYVLSRYSKTITKRRFTLYQS